MVVFVNALFSLYDVFVKRSIAYLENRALGRQIWKVHLRACNA